MQVSADRTNVWTAAQAEHEMAGFKFSGPGMYLTKTDTLLVVPEGDLSTSPWKQRWPNDTQFRFNHYGPLNETIFAAGIPPTRRDER